MIRPDKRTTVALTAILLVLPNAFWKADSAPRQPEVRVSVRPARVDLRHVRQDRRAPSTVAAGSRAAGDRSLPGKPRGHGRR